jgi:hypothetical protein
MPSEEDIAHQQKLLAQYRFNLKHLLLQQAQLGLALTPIGVINSIDLERKNIRHVKGILRGWNLTVDDHPDDEPPADDAAALAGAARAGQPATTQIGRDQINAQHSQGAIVGASGQVGQNFGQQSTTNAGTVIHIHGGDFRGTNLPIGNTIGRDLNQGGDTSMSTFDQRGWNVAGNVYNIAGDLNMAPNPSKDEFIAALRQLKGELAKAKDLPPDEASDLSTNLNDAIEAAERPQPNKDRTVKKLTTMQQILDGLKDNIGSALALGHLIGQVLLAAQGLVF